MDISQVKRSRDRGRKKACQAFFISLIHGDITIPSMITRLELTHISTFVSTVIKIQVAHFFHVKNVTQSFSFDI